MNTKWWIIKALEWFEYKKYNEYNDFSERHLPGSTLCLISIVYRFIKPIYAKHLHV